ncbi:MAG: transaldolase [Planctomycetota bacterium]|jgi:transaldolase|nr:transaldolase [Planctomycetota bacterium]
MSNTPLSDRTHLATELDTLDQAHCDRIASFVTAEVSEPRHTGQTNPCWHALRELGTELWLDTGDSDAAAEEYSAEFSALTTNNSLLNKEIQKGSYDELIEQAARLVNHLDQELQILELGMILNARHGLRLAQRFGGRVSVELHTALADDADASVLYGKRLFAICPEHFVIKVPHTPAGLVATRRLRALGIPVNHTLGFSARQNAFTARFSQASWVNVFMGRLDSYLSNHNLGTGALGSRVTLGSQSALRSIHEEAGTATWQIAASLRDAEQVQQIAGVDVITMPTAVAAEVRAEKPEWRRYDAADLPLAITASPGVDSSIAGLWATDRRLLDFAGEIDGIDCVDAEELQSRCHEAGFGSLFPYWTAGDREQIIKDGKIPDHQHWAHRIGLHEIGIDTLLTMAGLAAFAADQAALDQRISQQIGA